MTKEDPAVLWRQEFGLTCFPLKPPACFPHNCRPLLNYYSLLESPIKAYIVKNTDTHGKGFNILDRIEQK